MLHSAAIIIIPHISYFDFNIELIGQFISGATDQAVISKVYENISFHFKWILWYYSIICLIASFAGHFSRLIVRLCIWVVKYPQLRFTTQC